MWYEIGKAYPPEWRGKPPQMLNTEVPTWYKYLDKHQTEYKVIYYNLALTLQEPPANTLPTLVAGWMHSIAKRIDAVGIRTDGSIDIIEVTTSAGLRSVGQGITYRELWTLIKPLKGPFRSMVVCDYANPDVKYVCEKYGVTVIEV